MKCKIISIGDELLIGQVINSNAAEMSQMLTSISVEVEEVLTVADDHNAIVQALKSALGEFEVVITTGGLGPTKDDITQKAIAEATGSELEFSQEAYDHLTAILGQFGKKPGESHRIQCYLPSTADLMHNGVGTAPGMHFEVGNAQLFVLPGVPHEMRFLMKNGVLPKLIQLHNGLGKRVYTTFATVGQGESNLADTLEHIEDNLPDYIKFAYLPAPGRVRLRVMGFIRSEAEQKIYDETSVQIRQLIGKYIYAEEDIPLPEAIGRMLTEREATVSFAESCTGGYTSHLMTSIPGSSAYFLGGAVTYSNALKQSVLGVNAETLETYGAVSEETAIEMAEGARSSFKSDYSVAITGIAGPGGGTAEKPVGTVWIAASGPEGTETRKLQLTRTRAINIQLSAIAALNQLRKCLKRTN